jgi:UDP-N-acetylmuramoyl-tripeptide--D-alanyl-D-alanine ligase
VIPLGLDEVEALCSGRLERTPGARSVTGVQIDSRRVCPGDLFVAVGPGDAYVASALAAGAAAALVPEDAFLALATLGRAVRDRCAARVVAITGSTGKTSTKDILAAICAPRTRTVAAEASYNNELGVPLTLCRFEPDTEVGILELAMRGRGEIAALADIARPDVGVITNVGPAHVELVGSLDAVVQAKGELVEALPSGGVAVVPATFPVARTDVEVVRVGEPDATVENGATRLRFAGRDVVFMFRARHQARNALAALHAAHALGLEVEGTVDVAFSPWRGEEVALPGGGLLVNDSYNANPASMRAALEDLADRAGGRCTVAVLGDMAELGPEALTYHREIGALAGELGVTALLAVGDLARHYLEAAGGVTTTAWAGTAAEAVDAAKSLVDPGDCVLVKGSRVVGLEAVAAALTGRPV